MCPCTLLCRSQSLSSGAGGKGLRGSDFPWGLCRQKGHDIFLRAAFKAHDLERRVMYLTEKNKKLKLKMKKRNELMQAWGFIKVLGISIVATFVSGWSNNPY